MTNPSYVRLQITVFTLVSAAFTNIYITQPVLPVLQHEFSADMVVVSLTVSAVILGIACSNLPFGFLADRLPIHRIILLGGVCVASCGLICALAHNLWTLIAVRFLQGLFIPALTTCLAAYLSKTLPIDRLNVVMGSYVSATVIGGLGGRLLGGWLHPPLHWRYAFLSAAAMVLVAAFNAFRQLPRAPAGDTQTRTPHRLPISAGPRGTAADLLLCRRQLRHFLLDLQLPPLQIERTPVQLFNRADHLALRGLCDRHFHGALGRQVQQPVRQRQYLAGRHPCHGHLAGVFSGSPHSRPLLAGF